MQFIPRALKVWCECLGGFRVEDFREGRFELGHLFYGADRNADALRPNGPDTADVDFVLGHCLIDFRAGHAVDGHHEEVAFGRDKVDPFLVEEGEYVFANAFGVGPALRYDRA